MTEKTNGDGRIDFTDPFAEEEVGVVVGGLGVQGGAEMVALEIAEGLDCPIYTAMYDPRRFSKEFNDRAEDRVVVLEVDSGGDAPFDEDAFGAQSYDSLTEVETLEDVKVEDIGVDVLIAADIQGGMLAYLSGKPYVTYTHHADKVVNDYFWDLMENKDSMREKAAFLNRRRKSVRDSKKAARKAEFNMCNSARTADQVHKRWGVSPDQTSVVYPPVDTEYFVPAEDSNDEDAVNPVDGEDFFLAVQRLEPYKNVHTIVEAAKRAKKHVVFVGTGTLEEYVRTQAQYSPYIHAFGYVDRHQLRGLYRGATATVQGTVKEDFGIAAVESLAVGTPTVLPASGGFLETVGEGYRPDDDLPDTYWTPRGILLGPDDFSVEGFAGAMQYAAGDVPDTFDPDEVFDAEEMRREAEKYSVDRFIDEVQSVLNEAVAE